MINALIWVIGLVGLGLMVFIHELGHFVAAKLNGVAVEVFSLGWGPRLVGITRGGTTYQISWFPIGGYCKMKGEMVPGIAGGGTETGEGAVPEKGSFLAAPPWRRVIIYLFGPIFNLAFAFIIFTLIWWAGFAVYSHDNRVILATDYSLFSFVNPSPAAVAGLKTGDRVLAIDGVAVQNFRDIQDAVSSAPRTQLTFTIQRGPVGAAQTLRLSLTPLLNKEYGFGQIGILEWVDPVVRSVVPGSAAAIAGLRTGDRIIEAGGQPVTNIYDLLQAVAAMPAKLSIAYERAGNREAATLVFVYSEKGASNLGLVYADEIYRSPRLDIGGAMARSVKDTWKMVTLTVKGIGLLFQGINLRNAVAGPLGITSAIGTVATSGFVRGFGVGIVSFFQLLSLLSVVLFLMNLLPIPAMDGGQIVLLVVEIARGRPVRSSLIWRLQLIGFTLMISLFVLVTLNDILRFSGR